MTVPTIHNISVKRSGWFSKYNVACSCSWKLDNVSGEKNANTQGALHVKMELEIERRKKLQNAARRPTVSGGSGGSGSPEPTARDLSDSLKNIRTLLDKARRAAEDIVSESDNILNDEDQALSPVEYEYWLVEQARATGQLEIIKGIEMNFKS
ncbi:hypothetical protein QEH42_gp161 [Microbacterium phage Pumpernickel]|uniref:Uncharacterized protein n=1 Tax=Microbacterium phage Pumpernickel TaxID=2885983 RepID=A0AAE9C2S1_9CAUD|nr:hypothetical protein QEH42_gp006 [Microbacterium phage Pumpernickel]YP_010755297.1 hypothetical protein QEH42_gp161 [Microbacterium phage Pumpernickel]UDL15797.1 hypothetical protein SEA_PUMPERNICKEL_6 [Microbacterium phage Pumpernickel]UDL16057.1 hypothetical protein SEA_PUMPERNICKEL_307 [Microbacterium phage Pumpernickel]